MSKNQETWDDRYPLMNAPYLHYGVITVTAAFAAGVDAPASVILVNALATVTLPLAADNKGKAYWIKNISAAFAVTINPTGVDTIDGAPTQSLPDQYDVMHVVSDGVAWYILSSSDL
jgi:hypothetical protein